MKQLINKHDKNVRLVGLTEAWEEVKGESATAQGERAHLYTYIHFVMPTSVGAMWCVWSGEDWLLADMDQPKARPHESEEFRAWLRERIKKQGYSAMGLSQSLGYSAAWLANILLGRSRLKEKDIAKMAAELGVTEKTLRSKRGAVAPKSGKSLHK